MHGTNALSKTEHCAAQSLHKTIFNPLFVNFPRNVEKVLFVTGL